MGPGQNEELLRNYRDRHIWLLEADAPTPQVSPYSQHATGEDE
jgi:hypothetical protein